MSDQTKPAPDDHLIDAYLEERLDPVAISAFEERLASEPALSRRLAAHVLLDLQLRDLTGSAPSALPHTPAPATPRRRHAPIRRWWPGALVSTAAALIAVVVLLNWPGSAPTGAHVAVVPTAGTTLTIDGQSGTVSVLRVGQTLRIHGSATLRWPDQATEATVTPSGVESGIAVVRLSDHGLILDVGAVDADVAPQTPGHPFSITAGDAVATVLGTHFRVERQGKRTLLSVVHGRVELRQGAAASVVTAGGAAVADVSGVVADTTLAELDRGLLARWSGDGLIGNRLRDLSANGHDGDASGVQAVTGRRGQALRFSGEPSSLRIPHADDLAIGKPDQPFSLALWLRLPVGKARGQGLLSKGRTVAQMGPTLAVCVMLTADEKMRLYRWRDGLQEASVDEVYWPVGNLTNGAWHHLAVVCEHAALRRCYLDGVEIGSDTKRWVNDTSNSTPWSLGRVENAGFTKDPPLQGDLEDVRLYGRALTLGEVRALAGVGR